MLSESDIITSANLQHVKLRPAAQSLPESATPSRQGALVAIGELSAPSPIPPPCKRQKDVVQNT